MEAQICMPGSFSRSQTIRLSVCKDCGKAYSKPRELEDHIMALHQGIKNHICEVCGTALGSHSSLLKHISKKHTKKETTTNRCQHCPKTYTSAAMLEKHCAHYHEPTKCDVCNVSLESKNQLRQHMLEGK